MEKLVTNSIVVQNLFLKDHRGLLQTSIIVIARYLILQLLGLDLSLNSWNSIQLDTLISTSLSRTANNRAHEHFEEAELEKIAFKFAVW